jgi:predicted TIM-barrel fold metal-dependent hydrolase
MLDVSLAVNHVGPRGAAVLAETLELAPFGSLLYASDGFALPELHHLGAVLFRRALARVLDAWLADDAMNADDARRVARLVTNDNARRTYRLDPS